MAGEQSVSSLVIGILAFLSSKTTAKTRFTARPEMDEAVAQYYRDAERLLAEVRVDVQVHSVHNKTTDQTQHFQRKLVWRQGAGIHAPDNGGGNNPHWTQLPPGALLETLPLLPELLDVAIADHSVEGAKRLVAASQAVQVGLPLPLVKVPSTEPVLVESDIPALQEVKARDLPLSAILECGEKEEEATEDEDDFVPTPLQKDESLTEVFGTASTTISLGSAQPDHVVRPPDSIEKLEESLSTTIAPTVVKPKRGRKKNVG